MYLPATSTLYLRLRSTGAKCNDHVVLRYNGWWSNTSTTQEAQTIYLYQVKQPQAYKAAHAPNCMLELKKHSARSGHTKDHCR